MTTASCVEQGIEGAERSLVITNAAQPGGRINDNNDYAFREEAGTDESSGAVRILLSHARDYLGRSWKLWFWVGFGLMGLLGVVRTSLLIIRKTKYGLDWSRCDIQADGPNTTVPEEPVESSEGKKYFHVADLLYVVHSLLHWPEYAFLAYGTYQLVQGVVREWDVASRRKIWKQMRDFVFKWNWFNTVSGIVIFIFIVASLVVPIISIIDVHEQSKANPNCSQQRVQLIIHYLYQVLSLLAHLVSPGIRIYMAVMVPAVKAIWVYPIEKEEVGIQTSSDDANTTEDRKAASTKYYQCVMDYEQRQCKVISVLRVFRAWFVFQWFINYFQFLVNLSQVIRPWVGDRSTFDLHHIRRMVYTVYDFLAFAIPHASGLKMNRHHKAYLMHLRKEQLSDARDKNNGTIVHYSLASMLTIEKRKKCDFVPSIPGTGISIPLDSPSYALGILLTIFALTGSFVNFS